MWTTVFILFFVCTVDCIIPNSSWSLTGPSGVGWGRVAVFDRIDANTLITGLDEGGGFITYNFGKSWNTLGSVGANASGQPGLGYMSTAAASQSQANTFWTGCLFGAFKSTNKGATWTNMWGGQDGDSIEAIGIDPSTANVVYLATGSNNGLNNPMDYGKGNIYITSNAGSTWTTSTPAGSSDPYANTRAWQKIVVDPHSPIISGKGHSRVYISGKGGFFVSTNGGSTWTNLESTSPVGKNNFYNVQSNSDLPTPQGSGNSPLLSGSCNTILVPLTTNQQYGNISTLLGSFRIYDASGNGAGDYKGGIFTSTNGGETWTSLELPTDVLSGAASNPASSGCLLLAASSDGKTFIASDNYNVYSYSSGKWTTLTNPSYNWINGNAVPTPGGNFAKQTGVFNTPSGIMAIDIAPTNSNHIAYADGQGIWIYNGTWWDYPHFDYGEQFAALAPGTLPSMVTHSTIARGQISFIVGYSVDFNPFNSQNVAITYDDVGAHMSVDGGYSWRWILGNIPTRDSQVHNQHHVLWDSRIKNVFYMGGGGRYAVGHTVFKTTDNGVTFTNSSISQLYATDSSGVSIRRLAINTSLPVDLTQIYAASDIGVFMMHNFATTGAWTDVSGPMANSQVKYVQIDPFKSYLVYAAGSNGLFASTNQGSSWTQLSTSSMGSVATISLCPAKAGVIVIASGSSNYWGQKLLYSSSNYGSTWNTVSPSSWNVVCGAVSPLDPKTLYVATYGQNVADTIGMYVSHDGGNTWNDFSIGLSYSLLNGGTSIHFNVSDASHVWLVHNFGVVQARDSYIYSMLHPTTSAHESDVPGNINAGCIIDMIHVAIVSFVLLVLIF